MTPPAAPNGKLSALLKRCGRDVPIVEAALLIAETERPGLEVAKFEALIDQHARVVRRAVEAAEAEGHGAIAILGAYLFRDVGFRGNRTDYYDPRNSYLDEVLERRIGIPITLSMIYCEVGRRAGLAPEPVGFPGHFLAKHELPGGTVVVDPFNAGRILGPPDLDKLLEARFGVEVPYGPQLLRAAEPREVLARLLRNLKGIYLKRNDVARAFRTVDQILLLEPGAREERRDRGLLAARLGRLDRALCDLVTYAQALPDTLERRSIRDEIDGLRKKRAEMN